MTRASRKKHHIIYKTTCKITGRWYVGMHSTDDLEDNYLGSGRRIIRSIKKYGKENHTREILEQLDSRIAASDREKEILTEEFRSHPLCLNCGPGGLGVVDRPATTEETKLKLSNSQSARWAKEKVERSIANDVAITMTRKEVLSILLTEAGQLNKNATRSIKKVLETTEMPSRTREANVIKRWRAVYDAVNNTEFPELIEQINAYVHGIEKRPTCKICQKPVTFFRFGQPYATYCDTRCQLLDPSQKNPVSSRWTPASHK